MSDRGNAAGAAHEPKAWLRTASSVHKKREREEQQQREAAARAAQQPQQQQQQRQQEAEPGEDDCTASPSKRRSRLSSFFGKFKPKDGQKDKTKLEDDPEDETAGEPVVDLFAWAREI